MNRQIIDLGVSNAASWHGILELLHRLCGGAADISYGDRVVSGFRLPSLEIRLDDPARLIPPDRQGTVHVWHDCAVAFGTGVPDVPAGDVYLMLECGAAATVYHAFLSLTELLAALGTTLDRTTFQWAWYSIPLAPFCDDLTKAQVRWQVAASMGAVCSLWMRCDNDESIRLALHSLPPCGEVRIHNLKTANTLIAGALRTDNLAKAFGLG